MKKAKFRLNMYKNHIFIWYPKFKYTKLTWKDKFDSPRCEIEPNIKFEWLWFCFRGIWGDDQYWEQWLWVYKYYDGDIEKAKKEWGWVDMETKQSTWVNY